MFLEYDALSKEVMQLWERLLGTAITSPTACFFALGGDSALFSILVKQLSEKFATDCTRLESCQISQLDQQINYIKQQISCQQNTILVQLQHGNFNQPLVLVHPIGGSLFTYKHLLNNIKTNRQIIGFQDPALTGFFVYYPSIEAQAESYVKVLLGQQKKFSSIILLGHSYGATLAFEMASQLIKLGFIIEHLIMLDGWAQAPFDITFKNQFKKIILRQANKLKLNYLLNNNELQNTWINHLWQRANLLLKYRPQSIIARGTLFVSKDQVPEYVVPYQASERWLDHISQLKIFFVPGNHETMLDKDHVAYLSEQINNIPNIT